MFDNYLTESEEDELYFLELKEDKSVLLDDEDVERLKELRAKWRKRLR